MIPGFGFNLFAALIFLMLPLACDGQDNHILKSTHKTTPSANQKLDVPGSGQPQAQQHEYVPHEVLIQFNTDADSETIARIQAELKLETAREFRSPNLFLMKITDGSSVEAVIEKLKAYQAVKYAEPNYVLKANP